MHRLWSYNDPEPIKAWIRQLDSLQYRMQEETDRKVLEHWREEIDRYTQYLIDEQRMLGDYLTQLERDYALYPDKAEWKEYHDQITDFYLLAGGHWAGKQESGKVHEVTHPPIRLEREPVITTATETDHALPIEYRRGRNKLFKK